MKTKEELTALKEKAEAESKEPRKLTEEELAQVNGGRLSEEEILARQQFIAAKGASEASAEDKALAGADPTKATARNWNTEKM